MNRQSESTTVLRTVLSSSAGGGGAVTSSRVNFHRFYYRCNSYSTLNGITQMCDAFLYLLDSALISWTESGDRQTSIDQMEQALPPKVPTPPSSRPSSSRRPRCRSLRGNLSTNIKPRTQSQPELIKNVDSNDFNFQKYKRLPAIGTQDRMNNNTPDVGNNGKASKVSANQPANQPKNQPANQPENQPANQPETLLLAVRLLDGSRYQHYFSSFDTFADVLQHMRSVAAPDAVPRHCEFVTSEVPRQIFSYLSVSLGEANIKTRTLLHLSETDSDEL